MKIQCGRFTKGNKAALFQEMIMFAKAKSTVTSQVIGDPAHARLFNPGERASNPAFHVNAGAIRCEVAILLG